MPRASNKTASISDSGSDTDSGSVGGVLSRQRYCQLRLEWALSTWEHNARAMRELQVLFERAFARDAVKAVQALMFGDLQTALVQAERMGRIDRTLDLLIAAAVRVLPKQKRSLVVASQKRAMVQVRRSMRQGSRSGHSSKDEGDLDGAHQEPQAALDDLPPEVVEAIFSHVGPVELARCACVNRSWRNLSRGADSVWRSLYDMTFQRPAATVQPCPATPRAPGTSAAYSDFQCAAAGRPRALLRWSGRVMSPGGPIWLSSTALRRMQPARVAALRCPRPEQVVSWACGRSLGHFSSKSSQGSGEEESSDDDGAAGAATRMLLWVLAPK